MWLEGVDVRFYNTVDDPNEINDLSSSEEHIAVISELDTLLFDGFDPEVLGATIAADQRRRLFIHKTTDGDPTYVNIVRLDDKDRYIRNAGATDTKARARLPYVETAKPDPV